MTGLAMTTTCPILQVTLAIGCEQWRRDKLIEARGILADAARHPSSLVFIAARVVVSLNSVYIECADANDMLGARDPRSLHAIAAMAPKTGGAE